MRRITLLVLIALLLNGFGVAGADAPSVTAPDAPTEFREIGQGRYSGSSADYSTEEPQVLPGYPPPLREIGYGVCIEGEEMYYTARCVEWGEWDSYWCHSRFWCRYLTPPQDAQCSGFPVRTEAWWVWEDESQPCQQDPENGEAWRVSCRGGYHTVYYGYTHYCVKQWWYSESSPEAACGCGIAYITIIGSAKTSQLITKEWDGNSWQYPQYMAPLNEDNPPGPWGAHFIKKACGEIAQIGLFERGDDRGQDQRPIWVGKVELTAGEYQEIVAHDEELRLPNES